MTHLSSGSKHNTTMAIIAYIIFFIPILTGATKKSSFVKYHVKQGLTLFLLAVLINVIGWIIPFYLWLQISWLLSFGVLILLIIGISNAVSNKEKPLPVIGQFADYFKF